jgi:hypothetical protein
VIRPVMKPWGGVNAPDFEAGGDTPQRAATGRLGVRAPRATARRIRTSMGTRNRSRSIQEITSMMLLQRLRGELSRQVILLAKIALATSYPLARERRQRLRLHY